MLKLSIPDAFSYSFFLYLGSYKIPKLGQILPYFIIFNIVFGSILFLLLHICSDNYIFVLQTYMFP